MQLWKKVFLGLFLGIVAGLILGPHAFYLKFIGDIFIRLIKMIIVPLVLCAIVGGISSVGGTKRLGKIGIKACAIYLMTTIVAVCIGISTALLFKPGQFFVLPLQAPSTITVKNFSFLNTLMDIIPQNIFESMANGNILQVVFFAVFAGFCINALGDKGKRVAGFFQTFSVLVFKMITMIVQLSPYAAFSCAAYLVGSQGMDVLKSLGSLVLTGATAFSLQYLCFGLMIRFFSKLSPLPFFKKSLEYQSVALSTSSSKAALPITMSVCRQKLGVSEVGSSFVLPLGASINMDGVAIYLGVCAIFVAQSCGVTLSLTDYGLIIFASTFGSIGAAGIPSGTMIFLPMVLQSVGLPIEYVALIIGIDRIMDMMRTIISITGDAAVCVVIDASEKQLNKEVYNG